MNKEEFEAIVESHSQDFDDSLVFSTNALAGEVGELCNVSKKMEYYKHFPTYGTRVDKEVEEGKRIAHSDMLLDEAGDVLFYLVQTLQREGLTLDACMEVQAKKLQDLGKRFDKLFTK